MVAVGEPVEREAHQMDFSLSEMVEQEPLHQLREARLLEVAGVGEPVEPVVLVAAAVVAKVVKAAREGAETTLMLGRQTLVAVVVVATKALMQQRAEAAW